MRSINYRLILAIVIAIAAHVYLGLHHESDPSGRPPRATLQQLIRAA